MRDGTNPNRQRAVIGYKPIVISAITHLPNLNGYHKNRWDVVQCSLETMRENAGCNNFQVMIWDNGSCSKFVNWLKNHYKPDFLILSPNVGKSIARASIVKMLPTDKVVGVADDDMYYYPDWLKKQLEVLTVYPRVGTVSGWPVRTQFRFHNQNTVRWGKKYARVEQGRFIPDNEERDFCTSIGRDFDLHMAKWNPKNGLGTEGEQDIKITFRGVEAYATGHHAQWIGTAGVIAPFLRYTKKCMPDERPFEKAVNDAGLLRLTTFRRYTRHIGNILDEDLRELWQK